MTWDAHPHAQRILRSIATNPPPFATIAPHNRWDLRDEVPSGFRVDCLRVIRARELDPPFLAACAAGRMDEARRIAGAVTVADAVERAIDRAPFACCCCGADRRDADRDFCGGCGVVTGAVSNFGRV